MRSTFVYTFILPPFPSLIPSSFLSIPHTALGSSMHPLQDVVAERLGHLEELGQATCRNHALLLRMGQLPVEVVGDEEG